MLRFERIQVQGYRRLRDATVQIRPLTVLIGPNGVGKTSFLEVWALLANSCVPGQLQLRLSQYGGISSVLTKDRAKSVSVNLRANEEEGPSSFEYELRLEPLGAGYQVARESLTQTVNSSGIDVDYIDALGPDVRYLDPHAKLMVRPNWQHNPFDTALAQGPKMFQEPERFRASLSSFLLYDRLDVSPNAPIRLPQRLAPEFLPGPQGAELVSCLFSLRETDRDRFELLTDTISAGFPAFERLDFPPVAAGTLTMTWKEKGFSTALYMHQLSEGTLRFLWLATTLLQDRGNIATLMIDEPEVSLHPQLMSLLVDLMRGTSQRSNVIVATHSDRLIRFLKPSEVLIADLVDGETQFKWGDSPDLDLDHWLSDYSLDQLWQMGVLGGRP